MKKFMRIALVFALAGATLMYTGCTKDYSGDISDLNKKVSEQQAAVTALQSAVANAQTAADAAAQKAADALAEAQKKATPADVQAAEERVNAKINDLVSGDVKALKDAVAALEEIKADERLTDLETAIKDFVTKAELAQELAALKGELEATIAAGDKVNADAIDDLEERFNELISSIGSALFTIDAPSANVIAEVEYAEYLTRNHKEKTKAAIFNEIAEAFPEVAEIEDEAFIEQGGHLPFMVSPAETVLDDSFEFELINYEGEVIPATISNPQEGFYGVEGYVWGTMLTKGGNSSCWTLDFDFEGYDLDEEDLPALEGLALCASNGEASAQTAFAYSLAPLYVQENVEILNNGKSIGFGTATVLAACEDGEVSIFSNDQISIKHGMDGIIVLGMPSDKQSVLAYEKYGITFDGTTIYVANYPEETLHISFNVTIAALGINGSVDKKTVEVVAFNPNAITVEELADKEVVNGAAKNSILWNVADYDFTAAKLVDVTDWSNHVNLIFTHTELDEDGKPIDTVNGTSSFSFYDGKGNVTRDWQKAETFGIKNVESKMFIPGEYDVLLTISERNQPVFVFTGEGKLTVTNDSTAISVKLLDSILDEDGVIKAVGTADVDKQLVTYSLKNALVYNKNVQLSKIEDADYVWDDETSWNWIEYSGTEYVISVPKNGAKYDFSGIHGRGTEANFVNGDARNLLATLYCFGNEDNTIEFPFQAKVIDPIYSDVKVKDQVLYFTNNPATTKDETKFELREIVESAKYVAGDSTGKAYNVFDTWTVKVVTPAGGKVEKKNFNYDLVSPAPAASGYTNRLNVSDKAEAQFMEDFKFTGFHEVGARASEAEWKAAEGPVGTDVGVYYFAKDKEVVNKSVLSKYDGNYKYTASQTIFKTVIGTGISATVWQYYSQDWDNVNKTYKEEKKTVYVAIDKLPAGATTSDKLYTKNKPAGDVGKYFLQPAEKNDDKAAMLTYVAGGSDVIGTTVYTWGEPTFTVSETKDNVYMLDEAGEFITIDLGTTSNDILRGFGMTDDEIQEAKYQYQSNNVKKLFLTKAMAEKAHDAWKKYYDGAEKIGGSFKTSDNQTINFYTASVNAVAGENLTAQQIIDYWKAHTKAEFEAAYGKDYNSVLTGDKLYFDAYESIKDNFAYVYAVVPATDAVYGWELKDANAVNYNELDQVYVEFDDPVEAGKFVNVEYAGQVNPYKAEPVIPASATAKQVIYVQAKASAEVPGGVVLGAKLVIVDQFGMKIEKPFTITIKQ